MTKNVAKINCQSAFEANCAEFFLMKKDKDGQYTDSATHGAFSIWLRAWTLACEAVSVHPDMMPLLPLRLQESGVKFDQVYKVTGEELLKLITQVVHIKDCLTTAQEVYSKALKDLAIEKNKVRILEEKNQQLVTILTQERMEFRDSIKNMSDTP